MPDGFESLAPHNLITFKSHHEAMDEFALEELISHYTDYRKQVSPSSGDMLPPDQFRLIAVASRFPDGLAARVPLTEVRPGVLDVPCLGRMLQVIAVSQLPEEARNALLHLFGPRDQQKRFGASAYRVRSPGGSSVLGILFQGLRKEGLIMPYTDEDLRRDALEVFLEETTAEQLSEMIPVDKLLRAVPVEKRLQSIPVEKRAEGLSIEDRLAGLSPEARAEMLRLLQAQLATPARGETP